MSFITVYKTEKPCNKVWNGKEMAFGTPYTQATGFTVEANDLNALHNVIQRITDNPCLSWSPGGYFPQYAKHHAQFNVMAATKMRQRLGLPKDADASGVQIIDEVPYIARLKANMEPSNVLLLDYDQPEGMPERWRNKTADELVDFLRSIFGKDVGFIALGSTSSRTPSLGKGKGFHLYCLIKDPSDLPRFKAAWQAQGFIADNPWSFLKPIHCRKDDPEHGRKAGDIITEVPWCITDPSVIASCERLDFIGKPYAEGEGAPEVLPAEIKLYPGEPLDTSTIQDVTTKQRKVVEKKLKPAGIALSATGFETSVVGGISLDDVFETEIGNITAQQFLNGDHDKLRCQIPSHIRDSSSWNGILRKTEKGTMCFIDNGTQTKYFLPDDVVDEITAKWGDYKPLPDKHVPVDDFDPNLLPEPFRSYAVDAAHRMQAPIEYIAVSLMVSLGGVVGRKFSMFVKQLDHGWEIIANLWGALIGRPTSMKTPSQKAGMIGVSALIKDARAAYAKALEEHERQKMIYDAKTKEAKGKIEKLVKAGKNADDVQLPEKPTPPTERRYLTNAGSVERLIHLLEQNPNGIIQCRDELTGWLRSMEKSASQDARAFYLEAWKGNGDSFSYDTVTHGHMFLPTGPCVSVIGTIQPGCLADIVAGAEKGGAGDDGLLQRFQMAVYPDQRKDWRYVDTIPDRDVSDAVKDVFKRVAELGGGSLHFDDEAQSVFVDWYTELQTRITSGAEDSEAMESHLGKYPELMGSLALLIHLVEHVTRPEWCDDEAGNLHDLVLPPVSKRAAEMAVEWCKLLESHARRIYALGANAGADAAKVILNHVFSHRLEFRFNVRELKRKKWAGLADGDRVDQALEILEDCGLARLEGEVTGGRQPRFCTIRPDAEKLLKMPTHPTAKTAKSPSTPLSAVMAVPTIRPSRPFGSFGSEHYTANPASAAAGETAKPKLTRMLF